LSQLLEERTHKPDLSNLCLLEGYLEKVNTSFRATLEHYSAIHPTAVRQSLGTLEEHSSQGIQEANLSDDHCNPTTGKMLARLDPKDELIRAQAEELWQQFC
jgi:hypothetical protein